MQLVQKGRITASLKIMEWPTYLKSASKSPIESIVAELGAGGVQYYILYVAPSELERCG
jgi:hypothetical protein